MTAMATALARSRVRSARLKACSRKMTPRRHATGRNVRFATARAGCGRITPTGLGMVRRPVAAAAPAKPCPLLQRIQQRQPASTSGPGGLSTRRESRRQLSHYLAIFPDGKSMTHKFKIGETVVCLPQHFRKKKSCRGHHLLRCGWAQSPRRAGREIRFPVSKSI